MGARVRGTACSLPSAVAAAAAAAHDPLAPARAGEHAAGVMWGGVCQRDASRRRCCRRTRADARPRVRRGAVRAQLTRAAGCWACVQSLLGENPCESLEPGTFDWHKLQQKDPYPNGEYGQVRAHPALCVFGSASASCALLPALAALRVPQAVTRVCAL